MKIAKSLLFSYELANVAGAKVDSLWLSSSSSLLCMAVSTYFLPYSVFNLDNRHFSVSGIPGGVSPGAGALQYTGKLCQEKNSLTICEIHLMPICGQINHIFTATGTNYSS